MDWYVLLSDSTSLTDVSASSAPASSTTRPEPVFRYAGCAACAPGKGTLTTWTVADVGPDPDLQACGRVIKKVKEVELG